MAAVSDTIESKTGRTVVWKGKGDPTSDGAGVQLVRVIGTRRLPDLDPFLLLDEFGTDDPSAYVAGFPDHPHRGFETVTYMLAGRMRHRDSRGNEGVLEPGSVQWMTAARGLIHSEMPEQTEGLMRGFQLWINLPAANKMDEPRYQDMPPDTLPVWEGPGVRAKVLAGSYRALRGPVQTGATDPLYVDFVFDAGAHETVPLPAGHAAFVYVYEGSVSVGGTRVNRSEIGVLSPGDHLDLRANEDARMLLIAGKPIREPVAKYGPFVMNTRAELEQAFADYHAGKFSD